MTPIAKMVEEMLARGVPHDAIVLAVSTAEQVMSGGISGGNPVDKAAERRREWDRNRRRLERLSGGNPVDTADAGSPSPSPSSFPPTPPHITTPSTSPPGPHRARDADVTEAVAAYNATAEKTGWPQAQRVTPARASSLRKRLSECGGVEGWRNAMAMARASPFLCGDNDRGWKADIDFFLQAKSFTKLMEGGYDGKNRPRGAQNPNSRDDAIITGMARAFELWDGDVAGPADAEIPLGRFELDG